MQQEKLYNAFLMFDANGDGFIDAEELKKVLGKEGKYKNQPK